MNRVKLSEDDLKTIANKKLGQLAARLCSKEEKVSLVLEYASVGELVEKWSKEEDEQKPSTSKEVEQGTSIYIYL